MFLDSFILHRKQFGRGAIDALPFFLVIIPFGAIFGVVATEAGLNIAQVLGFSFLVIAGAAQLAALQLLSENAPTLIIIVTALAVNLRMAMYSAALVPHFGKTPLWMRGLVAYMIIDQPFAMATLEYEKNPDQTQLEKIMYFFGVAMTVTVFWYISTLGGALLGERIPAELGIDFAVPLTFIAVVAPMMRTLAHVASAITSVVFVLILSFLPLGTGLLVAAAIALVVGSQVEVWMDKRKAKSENAT